MWFQENWFSTSILIGIAITLLFFWSMITGIHYLQSDQELDIKARPRIASFYITFSGNRIREFIYFFFMLEFVFIIILVFGLFLSIAEAISLLVSIWSAPFGMFCLALLMVWSHAQSEGN